jgi:hypothetical protein
MSGSRRGDFLVAPCTVAEANRYVQHVHRHNGPLPTARFAVVLYDATGVVHGVAVAGLPKARMLLDRGTLEVSRVATDGSRNACSKLYGACVRAARALGYRRLVTYTLEAEPGTSLRASGWRLAGRYEGASWNARNASLGNPHYQDRHDVGPKDRWEIALGDAIPPLLWPEHDDAQTELFAVGAS